MHTLRSRQENGWALNRLIQSPRVHKRAPEAKAGKTRFEQTRKRSRAYLTTPAVLCKHPVIPNPPARVQRLEFQESPRPRGSRKGIHPEHRPGSGSETSSSIRGLGILVSPAAPDRRHTPDAVIDRSEFCRAIREGIKEPYLSMTGPRFEPLGSDYATSLRLVNDVILLIDSVVATASRSL